jgi:hypothetical protein
MMDSKASIEFLRSTALPSTTPAISLCQRKVEMSGFYFAQTGHSHFAATTRYLAVSRC